MGVSKTNDHIWIKIKMPNPSQEPPASSKTPNDDLKNMDVLCTFKINLDSQNLDLGTIIGQGSCPNHNHDAKSQSETSSILQSPKLGLKDHEFSLHHKNPDGGPKFRFMVYQRPLTISKLSSRCWSPVRNHHPHWNPKSGLKGHGFSLHLQNQER